jgi:hypothetical protein
LTSAAFSAATVALGSSMIPAANAAATTAVLSSKYCASGVGEGCNDLAQGNDLIRSLQEKSAMNREKYARVRNGKKVLKRRRLYVAVVLFFPTSVLQHIM